MCVVWVWACMSVRLCVLRMCRVPEHMCCYSAGGARAWTKGLTHVRQDSPTEPWVYRLTKVYIQIKYLIINHKFILKQFFGIILPFVKD